MHFKFKYNHASCCGGRSNQTVLNSAPYTIHPEDPAGSMVTAFDRFANNYRVTPTTVVVTAAEMALLRSAAASSFSLANQILTYRKIPITVEG